MAFARFEVKVGKRGKGKPHSDYICRLGKYHKHDSDEEVEFTGYGNLPKWSKDTPSFFWESVDEYERKNGTAYREHTLSLPRELDKNQRHELIHSWIKKELATDFVYQYAIHNPTASDGLEQPHCHLMFCERKLDGFDRSPDTFFKRFNAKTPSKGGAKKMNTGLSSSVRKQRLIEQIQRWENLCNQHLKKANSSEQVSLLRDDTRKINKAKSNLIKSATDHENIVFDFDVVAELNKVRIDNEQSRTVQRRSADNRLIESERTIGKSKSTIESAKQAIDRFNKSSKSRIGRQYIGDTAVEVSRKWTNSIEHKAKRCEQAIIFTNESSKRTDSIIASSQRAIEECKQRLDNGKRRFNEINKLKAQVVIDVSVPSSNPLKKKRSPRPRF